MIVIWPKRNVLHWLGFVFFLLFFIGCHHHNKAAQGGPQPKHNVVLITIDTLRPDHLGCYGYDDIKTPNIDELAKDGILFTHAYSPSPLTFPSHVSMMTGLYPLQHGIQNNGTFILEDSAKTLAEILQKSGYKTGAIVASFVLASHFGLDQGFDSYDDHFYPDLEKIPDHVQNFRKGERVTDIAKRWLQKNHEDPFFLWVHYFDPHSFYNPPSPFDTLYKNNPYDGEIAYADQCLGNLIEEMRRLSLLENTYIIVVGDHGEGLWEHHEQTHGLFIYDTTLRVPLIVRYPKIFPKGNKVVSLVSTIDIMPTILVALGVSSKETLIQGTSLVPFFKGRGEKRKIDLYCESHYSELNLNWAPLEGIITAQGWKYIYAPKPELYNLKKDPGEQKNLASTKLEKVKSLHERWLRLKKDLSGKSCTESVAKSIALSPEARERLKSLGYISYSTASNEEKLENQKNYSLPDPKDMAPLLAQIDMARILEVKGEFDRAIQTYEKVLSQDPDNKMALYSVGLAYMNMGQLEKALDKIKKMAEIDPKNIDCLNTLGLLYHKTGMPDQAIQTYQKALQINPKVVHTHYNLGRVYVKINNLDSAIQEFQKMRSLTPDPVLISIALGNIGAVYAREGLLEKAVQKFKESISHNSVNRDSHISLADTYYHLKDIDNSIYEWKIIIDLWPDDYIACYNVAQLLLHDDKISRAILYLNKSLQIRPDYRDARMLLQQLSERTSLIDENS